MAGITNNKDGSRRLIFADSNGERRVVRVGRLPDAACGPMKRHVDSIAQSQRAGLPIDRASAQWLAGLGDDLHAKLAKAGLCEPRAKRIGRTLADLLDTYFNTIDVGAGTRTTYLQARTSLEEYFGAATALASFTPANLAEWRASMVESKLAPATVAKRVRCARAIFAKGVSFGMIDENPAAGLKAGKMSNPARKRFVTREEIEAVLAVCPSDEWRLIFALGRYGGLRIPSEAFGLEWADVDWVNGTLSVRSSKTGTRTVPIFADLRPHLEAVWRASPETEGRVITSYRDGNNINTQAKRIIRRAGLEPWPKTLHNLRASCATELATLHPGHVAAAWLGHTEGVADEHYRMVRAEDFDRATGGNGGTVPAKGSADIRSDISPADDGANDGAKIGHSSAETRSADIPSFATFDPRSSHRAGQVGAADGGKAGRWDRQTVTSVDTKVSPGASLSGSDTKRSIRTISLQTVADDAVTHYLAQTGTDRQIERMTPRGFEPRFSG